MLASNPVVDPWVVSTAQTPNPLRYCASFSRRPWKCRTEWHSSKRRNSNHFEVAAGGTSVALISAAVEPGTAARLYCRQTGRVVTLAALLSEKVDHPKWEGTRDVVAASKYPSQLFEAFGCRRFGSTKAVNKVRRRRFDGEVRVTESRKNRSGKFVGLDCISPDRSHGLFEGRGRQTAFAYLLMV